MGNVYDKHGKLIGTTGARCDYRVEDVSAPKPTLTSLQGLVDKMDRIAACMYPNEHAAACVQRVRDSLEAPMPGRDEPEMTAPERQAKDAAETARHDEEDAEAKEITTLAEAKRRIADLEDERDAYRVHLLVLEQSLGSARRRITEILDRHPENPDE